MFKFSNKTLGLSEIWQGAFELYKETITKVWYISLAMMFVLYIDKVLFPAAKYMPATAQGGMNPAFSLPHYGVGSMLLSVVTSLISLFLLAVMLHRIDKLSEEPDAPAMDSVEHILGRYLTLVTATVVVFIPVMIGALLFVLPGVFIAVLVMFVPFNIIFNNDNWLEAIKKSFKLVWGNWWRTLGVIIVPGIAIAIIQQIIASMFAFSPWLNLLVLAVIVAALNPYIYAVVLLQFNDLRLRQAGVTNVDEVHSEPVAPRKEAFRPEAKPVQDSVPSKQEPSPSSDAVEEKIQPAVKPDEVSTIKIAGAESKAVEEALTIKSAGDESTAVAEKPVPVTPESIEDKVNEAGVKAPKITDDDDKQD